MGSSTQKLRKAADAVRRDKRHLFFAEIWGMLRGSSKHG
jgi:hypothetical protein